MGKHRPYERVTYDIKCRCPRCEIEHVMTLYYPWAGKGLMPKFCKACQYAIDNDILYGLLLTKEEMNNNILPKGNFNHKGKKRRKKK